MLFRFLLSLTLCAGVITHAVPAQEKSEPLILAHFMPWYGSKDSGGHWGWHWTMGHFDPDRVRWDGRREIASQDYPLIGPYDSGDSDALECQVLLMKIAGIDGVIIDWYGTADFNDYAVNHRNTESLVPWLKKAGLSFAICYEDQSIARQVAGGRIEEAKAAAEGGKTLQWAEEQWFRDDAYVKLDGRPVLLVFGPQYFEKSQWYGMRDEMKTRPLIFGLPHLARERGADGLFSWPPAEGGRDLSPDEWRNGLRRMSEQRWEGSRMIPVVFPGFRDIYREAGLHASYGSIADRNGATFSETLDLALAGGEALVQIATWNDYGEGTVIEPTRSHGYRFLEQLQQRRGKMAGFHAEDLRLPVQLFQLRKRCGGEPALRGELDRVAGKLFAGKCQEAGALLDRISAQTGKLPATFGGEPGDPDPDYRLHTDILYRNGEDLTDQIKLHCRLDVYHPAGDTPFPTVVWLHGGGLTKGWRSIPVPLRNQGAAVVSVNYRLSPEGGSPAPLEDAAAAIAWTVQHIAEYGGDPRAVFVSGHSAGGYLATMTGLDKQWLAPHQVDADRLAGLVPFSGQMITHFLIRGERGFGEKQPVVDEMAPLFHVRKDAPPMLVITGDREKEMTGRYEETAYFWRMMKVAGHPDISLNELQGYDHGSMPEPAFPLLLRFVRSHLPKPALQTNGDR